MHGGAGAILSIGLLKAIPLERFEDCVFKSFSTGGDALITVCLWEVRALSKALCYVLLLSPP